MDIYKRPTLEDVLAAKKRIERYIVRTPLHRHMALEPLVGSKVFVKHENHQKLVAFKIRGGINLLSQMSKQELANGVATASSGNHGQSIAYAASLFGAKAHIAVPEVANPGKVQSMKNLGAEVVHHGPHFGAANEFMEKLSKEKGYLFIHSVKNMVLYAGVGTYTLEILEDLPEVDVIIVPVGGGSGAASTAIVAKSIKPTVRVIGVQASSAPAVYESWKSGEEMVFPMQSIAEGVATNTAYEPALSILRDLLDDFVLVSDEEMEDAILLHLEHSRNLVEHAGAASLAAAIKIRSQLTSKNVALIASGGNLSMEHLCRAMERYRD